MIATLTGKIDNVTGESCIIDVNGVGYQVFMPLSALETLSRTVETIRIFTHYHLREDGASLFGFLTLDDKSVFEKIISVSGIGPKTALAILGTLSGDQFREAIQSEDFRILTSVSGVGLKTAQRLILELKGKLVKNQSGEELTSKNETHSRSSVQDAVDALIALGYPLKDATVVAETIFAGNRNLTTPEIVRIALKNLDRK